MFSSVIFVFEELTILSLFLYGLGRNKLVKSNKLFSTSNIPWKQYKQCKMRMIYMSLTLCDISWLLLDFNNVHTILRHFDGLVNFPFTAGETKRDY